MSFDNKAFWAEKDNGGLPDDQVTYDNPPRIEPKRQYQWLFDPTEADQFPNKKQAIDTTNSRPFPGVLTANWENGTNFESGTGQQFSDRVFGSEPASAVSFDESNVHSNSTDNLNMGRSVEDQFRNDASVALSMSQDYNGSSLNYGGIRRVKINQVRDSDSGYQVNDCGNGVPLSMILTDNSNSAPMANHYLTKESSNNNMPASMYHSKDSSGISIPMSMSHSFLKEDQNMISFSGYQEEPDTGTSDRLINSYDLMMGQHSSLVEQQQSDIMKPKERDLVVPQAETLVINVTKKSENDTKSKGEPKMSKKVSPNNNNFPSNVRSLLSTGMLDGVPVKYTAWSQQELCGVIKGSGYLCSCESCGLSKVLNAFEFERHANCKTKHPNNHIFFENGKSIYAVVQELRSTPQNLLFEVIQTVTGSPINQKSFNLWKESYQAATRELQRIYGKDEKNQALQNEYV